MIYLLPGYLKKIIAKDIVDLNLHDCEFINAIMLYLEKKDEKRKHYFKNEIIFENDLIKLEDVPEDLKEVVKKQLDWVFISKREDGYQRIKKEELDEIYIILYFLYNTVFKNMNNDDTFICWGESIVRNSKIFCEFARILGKRFYFMWNFFLKDRVIISTTPFEYSLYGTPELVNLYKKKIFNNSDIEFLNDYLKEIPGKYNYSKEKILECVPDEYKNKIVTMDSPYDIFVPGQTPRLLGCEKILYNHDEEMTISLAQKYPNYKIVYKPHPFRAGFIKTMGAIKKELFELPNIFITADNIHEIFPKIGEVYTINSSVGIDAGLRGKKVHWMSKTPFSEFDLTKRENRYAFIHAARKISTHKKNLTKVMSNIVQYRLDETL
jgi:hypothetical protein